MPDLLQNVLFRLLSRFISRMVHREPVVTALLCTLCSCLFTAKYAYDRATSSGNSASMLKLSMYLPIWLMFSPRTLVCGTVSCEPECRKEGGHPKDGDGDNPAVGGNYQLKALQHRPLFDPVFDSFVQNDLCIDPSLFGIDIYPELQNDQFAVPEHLGHHLGTAGASHHIF